MQNIFYKKQAQELLANIEENKQRELFDALYEYRLQHRHEQFVSGWSKKYNELSDKARAVFEEVTDLEYNTLNESLIYDNLSDKYLYN